MEYTKLNNGVEMPMLGYGTLHIAPDRTKNCILKALGCGYRLIDTAASYLNEKEIGMAVVESNIPRKEIFLTSKVWVQDAGYENTLKAFQTSIANLQVDYLDLYLIHQPYGDYYGSWRALETLYQQGKVRAIGVCNFSRERFMDLWLNATVKPMVNQIEIHPFYHQDHTTALLRKCDCAVQAWGPFNEGQSDIFTNGILTEIAKKHERSVAQIILRWHYQRGLITIPKTFSESRMKENLAIFDFNLDEEDFTMIKQLDIGHSEIIDHQCYTTAKWLNKHKIHD
ncbi:MAG: aldo/keto reductase [Erysipelotrichaceae bacterium]|nr:aldo/keto reductase [Erysipelotrichaceae bacterium]MDD3809329.1 aldo/keto reductase [Erysipelotrichaceae bacterium]